jgi:hypothetical protein
MDVSVLTGSRSSTDNWTSFFTFILGIIGGVAYMAVMGDIAKQHEDAVKVFLGVITAMLGAALGFASSRLTDRITDRRKIRRKLVVLCLHIKALQLAWQRFGNEVDNWTKASVNEGISFEKTFERAWNGETVNEMVHSMARICRAAQAPISLDEIVETDEDMRLGNEVFDTFQFSVGIKMTEDGTAHDFDSVKYWIHSGSSQMAADRAAALANALEHFQGRQSEN